MPADRDRHILRQIIGDRNRFLQYLRFLLADEGEEAQLITAASQQPDGPRPQPTLRDLRIPLLEELVRAYSRRPDRLDRVAQLMDDLNQTREGRELIPEDFSRIWRAFVDAGKRGGS